MTPTTNIIDLELSDDELDHVCGGFTSSEHSAFEAPAPGGGPCNTIDNETALSVCVVWLRRCRRSYPELNCPALPAGLFLSTPVGSSSRRVRSRRAFGKAQIMN